tara:strand:+ start:1731 stop:2504 length:774 start_codon:yes stop_codon:yes gene_type:complete
MKYTNFSILIFLLIIFYISPTYALDSREILFREALTFSSEGEFDNALDKWNDYLRIYPDDPAALSNRGNVKLVVGDPKGSLIDQNRSIQLNPNELDPYINRGIANESLGLWLEAKEDYLYVISKDKENFSALYNLANVEGSLDNWEKARSLFSNAAQYNPGFAMARSSEALANYQLGNFDASEKELRKLIRRYPTFADARAALTALQWSKGKSGEAESNWIAAVELDPRYSQEDWLLEVRRWPPAPVEDLMKFISIN